MTETDSGSDDEQTTTPVENPSNPSNPDSGNNNPSTPSNPETPKTTYTITFDSNGGNGEMNPQTAESGTEIALSENVFTKEGYIFAGWATSADGDVSYSDKAKITVTSNITIYAKWNPKKYTVTFNANGGSGTMNLQSFIYGELQKLSQNEFTMANKDFLGWAKSSSGSISYYDNSEFTIGTENVTLYAVWGKIVSATTDDFAEKIAALEQGTSSGNQNIYTIKITSGEITSKKLYDIGVALAKNKNHIKYNLVIAPDVNTSGPTEIIKNTFSSTNLIGITLPNFIKYIKEEAFSNCLFENIVIPDSVKTIAIKTFYNCSHLTKITLPASLTTIGTGAFEKCNKLEAVNYKGTQTDWTKINIDSTDNEKLSGAKIICTDGVINGE